MIGKYSLSNMINAYKNNKDIIEAYINNKPIEKNPNFQLLGYETTSLIDNI